jgi:LuxR family maltose regulon positive regulatory protein
LVRALNLAEPEGYARIFLDEGAPMIRLLETIATGRGPGGLATASRYAHTLLAMVAPRPPDAAGPAAGGRQVLAEPLGQREIDVLRLMAAGASNGDIARELVIGSATVKTHVNRIFRKLDARSRTQAVARARALGLLAP